MTTPAYDEVTFDNEQAWDLLAEKLDILVEKWESAPPPPELGELLPSGPAPLRRLLLVELIKLDLEYRWAAGSGWTLDEYVQKYPDLASEEIPAELIYEEYHVRRTAGDPVSAESIFKRFPAQRSELSQLIQDVEATHSTQLNAPAMLQGIEAGKKIDDFELITMLGEGAFAKVFLARQESMQRLVALKVSADRGTEPQTLAQFDHPNIIRVYDLRTLHERRVRLLYMQYIPGGTLKEIVEGTRGYGLNERTGRKLLEIVDRQLETRGVAPPTRSEARAELEQADWPETVCRLGIQLAAGLAHAHQVPTLHRDLKPANVLVTSEGIPLLADFNISFSANVAGATPAAYFGGSLAYMSPEQLESCHPGHPRQPEDLDARSDIYSLGIVLAELLTGRRPYSDISPQRSWSETVESLSKQREQVPKALLVPSEDPGLAHLHSVLAKCLAPNRDDRWSDSRLVAQQLRIGLHTRAMKLFNPPASHWTRWITRFPIAMFLIALLIPTAAAAVANYLYNAHEISLPRFQMAQEAFDWLQMVINAVSFPVGLSLAGMIIWRVHRALSSSDAILGDDAISIRRRALNLPHYGAMLCVVMWLIAGGIYAMGFGIMVPEAPQSLYLHFFASLTLTGLVAASYPFFASALIAIPGIYAPLINRSSNSPHDTEDLDSFARRVEVYLCLAAIMPFLAIIPLVSFGGGEDRFPLLLCSVTGFLGFGLAYLARAKLQKDIEAMKVALTE